MVLIKKEERNQMKNIFRFLNCQLCITKMWFVWRHLPEFISFTWFVFALHVWWWGSILLVQITRVSSSNISLQILMVTVYEGPVVIKVAVTYPEISNILQNHRDILHNIKLSVLFFTMERSSYCEIWDTAFSILFLCMSQIIELAEFCI